MTCNAATFCKAFKASGERTPSAFHCRERRAIDIFDHKESVPASAAVASPPKTQPHDPSLRLSVIALKYFRLSWQIVPEQENKNAW